MLTNDSPSLAQHAAGDRSTVPAASAALAQRMRTMRHWSVGIPVVLFAVTFAFFGVYALDDDSDWLLAAFTTNVAAILAAPLVVRRDTAPRQHGATLAGWSR